MLQVNTDSISNEETNNPSIINTNATEPNARIKRLSITNEDRRRIVEKSLEGHSTLSISDMLNIKYQSISTISRKYYRIGEVMPTRRGGDRRSKLTDTIKEQVLEYVDQDCTRTLRQIVDYIYKTFTIRVYLSTIDRVLRNFHYTIKNITLVLKLRNSPKTIESRATYATNIDY
ncbi:Paired box protein Pax-2a [Cucumispora dikerogammari]|nr:Paired box protein Pax-2a [Cucumispora dikerogammari]